jgi:signal transduction histidine kinase
MPSESSAAIMHRSKEQERHRIAVGVHGDSLQAIFAVSLGLANLRPLVNDPEAEAVLERLQETVRFASERLRSLLFDLQPAERDDMGLGAALRAYLERAEREEGLTFTLDDQLPPALDGSTRGFLFSITQELLMNVRKHAHASHVEVSLSSGNGRQVIRVSDDGVGFDVAQSLEVRPGHLGLAALVARVEHAGGVLRIDTAPGAGATVEFEVPTSSTTSTALRFP